MLSEQTGFHSIFICAISGVHIYSYSHLTSPSQTHFSCLEGSKCSALNRILPSIEQGILPAPFFFPMTLPQYPINSSRNTVERMFNNSKIHFVFYVLRPSGFIVFYTKERFISQRAMLHIPDDNKISYQIFIISSSIKKKINHFQDI